MCDILSMHTLVLNLGNFRSIKMPYTEICMKIQNYEHVHVCTYTGVRAYFRLSFVQKTLSNDNRSFSSCALVSQANEMSSLIL